MPLLSLSTAPQIKKSLKKHAASTLIISRTPVRISFFGGGTDYPDFYKEHKGAVLGTTIDQYTYISVKTHQSSFFEHSIRVAYSKTELAKNVADIEHPSVRECLKYMQLYENLDVHIFSDLPAKTGLGSSSSFTVGFLHALHALQGKRVSKQRLAEEACFVEQEKIKENVGSQDQFHAAFGGFNLIEFQSHGIEVRPVIMNREKKELLEDHLLIFFTGLTRFASAVVEEQVNKTKTRQNDTSLLEMLSLVYEAEKILASNGNIAAAFGTLLNESWKLKKSLSSKISNSFVDDAYNAAMQAGAYGGKLCGAGSGGFLAFFVSPEKQEAVREALHSLQEVTFRFENEGSSIIYLKD